MRNLRVATYNVHKCRGMDGQVRPDRIARVLEEINADVVALQEVLSIRGHREELDQATYLANCLRMHQVQAQARRIQGGVYGNVLLTRFPIRLWRNLDITHVGREERSVLRADLRVEGRLLHFFNVHLGTSYFERRRQAGALLEGRILRAPDLGGERILLGDLNEWTRGLVTRSLTHELRRIDLEIPSLRRRTYPALLPVLHLDYIYFEHTLRARDAFFHRSRLALLASDHLPLVADFSL
ncbi:MAG: endonuclease/exonuclease/phosphatase family protein [Bryobacteraceae bacterium]|nr:endonuclease/exonuclease/phosphatase family protein [Bryobacteraceae bacterium]MDW8378338.1 endonuclease/exonuclease/phosphatase family protein [Bryobacterales bacterium]